MVIVANLCKRVLHQLVNGGLRAKIEELLLFVSKGPRIDQKEGLVLIGWKGNGLISTWLNCVYFFVVVLIWLQVSEMLSLLVEQ